MVEARLEQERNSVYVYLSGAPGMSEIMLSKLVELAGDTMHTKW